MFFESAYDVSPIEKYLSSRAMSRERDNVFGVYFFQNGIIVTVVITRLLLGRWRGPKRRHIKITKKKKTTKIRFQKKILFYSRQTTGDSLLRVLYTCVRLRDG